MTSICPSRQTVRPSTRAATPTRAASPTTVRCSNALTHSAGAIPEGDRVAAYVTQRGKTTYVTYTSNGLPLTNLIRDVVPFGKVIADVAEPVLTAIVNSAYPQRQTHPRRSEQVPASNTVLVSDRARRKGSR
jgi:PE-PPE domain